MKIKFFYDDVVKYRIPFYKDVVKLEVEEN